MWSRIRDEEKGKCRRRRLTQPVGPMAEVAMTSIEPHPCRTRVHWSRSVFLRDVTCGVPDVVWCLPRAEGRSISSLSGSTCRGRVCRLLRLPLHPVVCRPWCDEAIAIILCINISQPSTRSTGVPSKYPSSCLVQSPPTSGLEARISHLDPYKSHALAPVGHGIVGSDFGPFPADPDANCKPEYAITAQVPDAPTATRPSGPRPPCHNRPRKPEMDSIRSGPASALPRQGYACSIFRCYPSNEPRGERMYVTLREQIAGVKFR